jgi:hypothetical protein
MTDEKPPRDSEPNGLVRGLGTLYLLAIWSAVAIGVLFVIVKLIKWIWHF